MGKDLTKQTGWVTVDLDHQPTYFLTWNEALKNSNGKLLMSSEYYKYHWLPEHTSVI